MILKGDPHDIGIAHDFIMYCPRCNERQYDGETGPNSMVEVKKMKCPKCSEPLVDIDEGMYDVVQKLNKEYQLSNGKYTTKVRIFETVNCCEGHWRDIYNCVIPYVQLKVSNFVLIPLHMLNMLTTAEISYNIDMSQFDGKDELKYISAVNNDTVREPDRLLTIRMNVDNIIGSMSDEREFPGYSEKCFNRRKKIFLKQLETLSFMCMIGSFKLTDVKVFTPEDYDKCKANVDNTMGIIEQYLKEHNTTLEEVLKKNKS